MAKLKQKVGFFLFISVKEPSFPYFFAHSEIYFFNNPFVLAINFIFSSIFSQTLGTPKKNVGLHSYKVVIKVPCKALGSANHVVPPLRTKLIISVI